MKSQGEFLNDLEDALKYLNPKDRSEVLKHYRDKINNAIDYGESEQKVIATLPSPDKIAEEIYKSKGITYLEKKKKEYKRKSIVKSICSGLLIFILCSGFVGVSYFFGKYIVNLCQLSWYSFSFFNLLDTSSLLLFNISYICILIIGYIYVFDLFYIMVMYFLQIILDYIYKEIRDYPFTEFTISGTIEKHIKKKKFLPKLLLGFVCCLLVFGITSYASKGYLYRSMNNTLTTRQKMEITDVVENIVIPENSSFIKVSSSSEVSNLIISYGSEFEEKLIYQVKDGTLSIEAKEAKKFDPFGLLNEPQQIIEIIIPNNYIFNHMTIHFSGGTFDIVDVHNAFDLYINGSNFICAITNTSLRSLNIEGLEMNLALENNDIKNINVKMQSGRFCAVGDKYNEFTLGNYLGNIILQNVTFENANIENTSGKAAIDKLNTQNLTYKAIRSQDYFQDNSFTNFYLKAFSNSNVELDRLIVKEEFNIEEDSGYVKIDACKSKMIKITGNNGKNSFYDLGENLDPSHFDSNMKEYIEQYNYSYNTLTSMSVDTTGGSMLFSSSDLSRVDFNLQKTDLTINDSKIESTYIMMSEANINIADLDGRTIDVNAKKGSFMFYNDNLVTSEIILTIQTDGTTIGLGENIKKSES